MHEFAFGSTNLTSHFGPVRNPWDTGRISGGSSGGSAASVVTAQAIASFGTDTGGSIRIPSAACGCVGFKPSYSRIPMTGIVPLSKTLDHAGPLSRCVLDAAFLFEAATALRVPDSSPNRVVRQSDRAKNLVIRHPAPIFSSRIQSGVRESVLTAPGFRTAGADIREVG
jgi:aspartyl-tRNA(Asn)/glutamyl-tRNA(Gln) amidotransferase subunit A